MSDSKSPRKIFSTRRQPAHARRLRTLRFEALERRELLVGDITTGLVHHWAFDETVGDSAEDSAGNSDGTLVNWASGDAKWEPGRVGGALRFDSSPNYLVVQPPALVGSHALSFWVNATNRQGPNARIFTAKAGNVVFINHENFRGVSYTQRDDFFTFSSDPPAFNTWEHYAINFNSATGQGVIFRNGAPVALGAFADSASQSSWIIGHNFDLNNHDQSLHGALDEFRVYNRALSDDDIAILASQGTPEPTHPEPVHHWTFDETTGFTAHDIAGGANATLLNWNTTEPRWTTGAVGGALRFSTADNSVVTPPLGTRTQWSIAFWLQVAADSGVNPRIVTAAGSSTWAYLNLESDRGISFGSRNTDTFDPNAVPLGVWQHYAVNFDTVADTGTIYRNGSPVVTGFFADNAPALPWVFGHNSDLGNHQDTLNGLLDDLRQYDRLLSSAEIQQLVALGSEPIAISDEYRLAEDTTLVIGAPGVLVNDDDGLGQRVIDAILGVEASHGSVALNSDGSFTYIPTANYHGHDSFTYRIFDGTNLSEPATVSLTITPVNDPPIAPQLVADANAFPNGVRVAGPLMEMGGFVYFSGSLDGSDWELWRSDGTPAGTTLVKDILDGPGSSQPSQLIHVNGTLFFRANDGVTGTELWQSDGTENGTTLVTDMIPGGSSYPSNFANVNGVLYFTAAESASGPATIYGPTPYLSAADSPFDLSNLGTDFWLEDFEDGLLNTPGVRAINGSVRAPSSLTDSVDVDDGEIDGDGSEGHSFLIRPGSLGTTFIFDRQALGGLPTYVGLVSTGGGFAVPNSTFEFFDAGGNLIEAVDENVRKNTSGRTDDDLFIGMYYAGGISMIRETNFGTGNTGLELDHLQYGGIVLPSADKFLLWKSDGSSNGTAPLTDLAFVPDFQAANVGGMLYFTGNNGVNGVELWKSNGTPEGTLPVNDIRMGSGDSNPSFLTNVNGMLYFAADDGINGTELWTSGGTEFSTTIVSDILPGPSGGRPTSLVNVNGLLYFSASDGVNGFELWKSDGTAAGTKMVKNVRPNPNSSDPHALTNVNGLLYFVANDGSHLFELWKSDGTDAGTMIVKDIGSNASSNPHSLANVDGNLLFGALTAATGYELWSGNGPSGGVVQAPEISSGAESSAPTSFVGVPGRILFTAEDALHRRLLFTARQVAANDTLNVPGQANIFGAGHALPPGVQPGILPTLIDLLPGQHRAIQFTATGEVSFDNTTPGTRPFYGPDGGPEASSLTSTGGISGIHADSYGYLVGVFLGLSEPANPPPPTLDFRGNAAFPQLSPLLNQTFFIGDGLTGTGTGQAQTFFVPEGATRLYFGLADTFDVATGTLTGPPKAYHDNAGLFVVNYKLQGVPLNAAPSFTMGPNIVATDEQPFTAPLTTITFDDLTGPPDNLLLSPYFEGGFTITPISGRWIEAQDPSHITGHPAPAVYSDTYFGTLEIVRTAGGTFAFGGFDLASWEFDFPATDPVRYTVIGTRQGQTVFSATGEVGTSDFRTIASPSGELIDRLRFNMVRLDSQAYILDNIKVSADVWARDIAPGAPDESQQTLTFTALADKPELFQVQPRIDANGKFTFVPMPNVRGTATVTVHAEDDGGTLGGGVDQSSVRTFTIEITKPHPWHNSRDPASFGNLDVNGKDGITLIDAVMVLNYLNSAPPAGTSSVPVSAFTAPVGVPQVGYIDVAIGDENANFISTLDALLVINYLNTASGEGEAIAPRGEHPQMMAAGGDSRDSLDALYALLAFDAAETAPAKRRR